MNEAGVPVTLIAGYLGAGKTTWLNARIAAGLPGGALILVNDFGTINIDADLIAWRDDRMIRLTNGCICCSLAESLAAQLAGIARWSRPPSAVLIETSGVAEPARIADLLLVSKAFRLDTIVCLVDAASLDRRLADTRIAELVVAQIAAADCLSINRLPGDGAARAAIHARLDALNAAASRHETALDSVPIDDTPRPARTAVEAMGVARGSAIEGTSAAWARFALRKQAPVNRKEIEAVLARYADVLARAKGVLRDAGGPMVFQWADGQARWSATSRAAGVGQLVGIGFRGRRFDALVTALEAL